MHFNLFCGVYVRLVCMYDYVSIFQTLVPNVRVYVQNRSTTFN